MTLRYKPVNDDSQLLQILHLQKKNLPGNLSDEELKAEGFVTVEHNFSLLKRMNKDYPHILALDKEILAGYALVMLPKFRNEIEILIPMFDEIDRVCENLPAGLNYFVMGQICVAKPYRGKGIFYKLYEKLRDQMQAHFDACITEVDPLNPRSLKAHRKLGFELFKRYSDPKGRPWDLIIWNWKN